MHIQIDFVFIVLTYAKVAARNRERAVIINFHYNCQGYAILPSVVSECFSQRVTGDTPFVVYSFSGSPYQAIGLNTADSFFRLIVQYKEGIRLSIRNVDAESGFDVFVNGDDLALAGFLFVNSD